MAASPPKGHSPHDSIDHTNPPSSPDNNNLSSSQRKQTKSGGGLAGLMKKGDEMVTNLFARKMKHSLSQHEIGGNVVKWRFGVVGHTHIFEDKPFAAFEVILWDAARQNKTTNLKRYSDFVRLHKKLKETDFKKLLPTLPPRKFFGNQDESFLDKRQVELDRYLKKLEKLVGIFDSEPLKVFMRDQKLLARHTQFEDRKKDEEKHVSLPHFNSLLFQEDQKRNTLRQSLKVLAEDLNAMSVSQLKQQERRTTLQQQKELVTGVNVPKTVKPPKSQDNSPSSSLSNSPSSSFLSDLQISTTPPMTPSKQTNNNNNFTPEKEIEDKPRTSTQTQSPTSTPTVPQHAPPLRKQSSQQGSSINLTLNGSFSGSVRSKKEYRKTGVVPTELMQDEKLTQIVSQVIELQEELENLNESIPTAPQLPPTKTGSPSGSPSPSPVPAFGSSFGSFARELETKASDIMKRKSILLEQIKKLQDEDQEEEEIKQYIQKSLQDAREKEAERKKSFAEFEAEFWKAEEKWRNERVLKRSPHMLKFLESHVSFIGADSNDLLEEDEDGSMIGGCVFCGQRDPPPLDCSGFCSRTAHLACLPEDEMVVDGAWTCTECQTPQDSCIVCGKSNATLLHCQGSNCSRSIHRECQSENLEGDKWLCLDCFEVA